MNFLEFTTLVSKILYTIRIGDIDMTTNTLSLVNHLSFRPQLLSDLGDTTLDEVLTKVFLCAISEFQDYKNISFVCKMLSDN